MTDPDISKQLALAIGWKRVLPNEETTALKQCRVLQNGTWRVFDYRDWTVIGPIAERYDAFPIRVSPSEWWSTSDGPVSEAYADTPQKAIALAVIGAKK